jgi:hypothetical protein
VFHAKACTLDTVVSRNVRLVSLFFYLRSDDELLLIIFTMDHSMQEDSPELINTFTDT